MKLFNFANAAHKAKRNVFDLSHERKFSCNPGDLIPVLCEEVVPGDSWSVNTESLVRMAPLISPLMHRVDVFIHYFFVPNRIIWDDWQDFITGGEDGNDSSVMPYFSLTDFSAHQKGSLSDYLGVNFAASSGNCNVSVLPYRAYQLIFNEYYRDQNLQDKVIVNKTGGQVINPEYGELIQLRKRNWEKDYFTSCLPDTQKGGEVLLPLGNEVDVKYRPNSPESKVYVAGTGSDPASGSLDISNDATDKNLEDSGNLSVNIDNSESLYVDLQEATAASINDLRRASRLQEWLERNMRGGSRYIESILSHFGVKSSDARLQRPEYLGGGRSPIVISEVMQTSGSPSETGYTNTPLGEMAGHGISAGNTNRFKRFFEEHGFVFGIMSVMPKTAYQQGLRRHFTRFDKFDYYWPEFAHLGEQAVLNRELYNDGTAAGDDTFGYQSRYAEYKYVPSSVHGDFKDNLDFWHWGRKFSSAPALNSDFISYDDDRRIFAVTETDNDVLWCQLYHSIRAKRKMPVFGTPYL